jgi:hypothetical protein
VSGENGTPFSRCVAAAAKLKAGHRLRRRHAGLGLVGQLRGDGERHGRHGRSPRCRP